VMGLGLMGLGKDQGGDQAEDEGGNAETMVIRGEIEEESQQPRNDEGADIAKLKAGIDNNERNEGRAKTDEVEDGEMDGEDHLGQKGQETEEKEVNDDEDLHGGWGEAELSGNRLSFPWISSWARAEKRPGGHSERAPPGQGEENE